MTYEQLSELLNRKETYDATVVYMGYACIDYTLPS